MARTLQQVGRTDRGGAPATAATSAAGTTTFVALDDSNCTRCHDDVLRALRRREHVRNVRSDFAAGCLVVEHDEDPASLVALVGATGHAVALAANGERVMVAAAAHEAAGCEPAGAAAGGDAGAGGDATGDAQAVAGAGGATPGGTGRGDGAGGGRAATDVVDEWGYGSFPASDPPPSWNLG